MRLKLRARLFDDQSPQVDRFGVLLVVTVCAIVVMSLFDLRPEEGGSGAYIGTTIVTFFTGAMAMLAARASGVAQRWRVVVDVVVILTLAVGVLTVVVSLLSDNLDQPGSGLAVLWLLVMVMTPVAVIRRILRHRRVTLATLLGAISAYLLIAIAFTFLYLSVDAVQSPDFFGGHEPSTSYMYFSLTTATTLGYGDLTAASEVGRFLSVTEAVIGQVYLVTLVAYLVSLYAQHSTGG